MFYRLMIILLMLFLLGAPLAPARQVLKEDTEKDRAKRAAENSTATLKDEAGTRVEKFLARKDVLIIKEATTIGSLPGQQGAEVKIEAIVLSALGEAAKVYGLSFIRLSNRGGERQPEAIRFVDFDEVAALQNALEHLVKTADANSETPAGAPAANGKGAEESGASNVATEFSLTTRGGLKIGMLQVGRQQTGFLRLESAASEAPVIFGIGALTRLRNLTAQGRARLVSLGAR
ncbi:MAG: hypothetical protein HY231_05485 [Acidobacteria bacterium]|nr:hypothetical protein [Acidobacteriota bacterium]